jgi:phosphotransferase system HPr (HPr) family protein
MLEDRITVVNRLGLHARAAAQLVRLAGSFESSIMLLHPGRDVSANAKSILSVLTLAASMGTVLHVTVDGVDEEGAMAEIASLFANRFGESF